jgi:hypothetical protein
MFGLPLGLIEQIIRLINNLLEARPPEQRAAEAKLWFWKWWPLLKIGLKADQAEEIERIMEGTR